MDRLLSYRGQPIEAMTRGELIEVVEYLKRELDAVYGDAQDRIAVALRGIEERRSQARHVRAFGEMVQRTDAQHGK